MYSEKLQFIRLHEIKNKKQNEKKQTNETLSSEIRAFRTAIYIHPVLRNVHCDYNIKARKKIKLDTVGTSFRLLASRDSRTTANRANSKRDCCELILVTMLFENITQFRFVDTKIGLESSNALIIIMTFF